MLAFKQLFTSVVWSSYDLHRFTFLRNIKLLWYLLILGEIQQLLELQSPEDYVCSVKWIKEGNVLAVGNFFGEIALWDVEQMKKMRTMTGHTDRIGSLSWNEVCCKY